MEKIPNPHNPFALAALANRSPPSSDLDQYDIDLWKVVEVATGPERPHSTDWIISTSPVIVAIGPERPLGGRYEFPRFESDGKIHLGSSIRLVSEAVSIRPSIGSSSSAHGRGKFRRTFPRTISRRRLSPRAQRFAR